MIKTFETRPQDGGPDLDDEEQQQQDISGERSTASQRSLFEEPDIPTTRSSSSRPASTGLDREVISGREMDLNSIGGSGRGIGSSSGSGGGSPSNASTNPLDNAAAKARRKIDREAKLRQMEDAVAVASGDARNMMDQHRSGQLTTTNVNFTDVTIEEEESGATAASGANGKEGGGRKLLGLLGGNGGPPSSTSSSSSSQNGQRSTQQQQQPQPHPSPSVSERIKSILPSSWDRANNASNNGINGTIDPNAFPDGSSLSTRSLTTTGRNLHDIGTAVPVVPPPSRAFAIGGGGADASARSVGSSGSNRSDPMSKMRLANSGITIDYLDPGTEAAQWQANGNHISSGSAFTSRLDYASDWFDENSKGWRRGFNTATKPMRDVMPTNKRKCYLWVAVLAILGVVFGTLAKIEDSPTAKGGGSVGVSNTADDAPSGSAPGGGAGATANIPPRTDPHDQSPGASNANVAAAETPYVNPNVDAKGNVTPEGIERMNAILDRVLNYKVSSAENLPTEKQVKQSKGNTAAIPDEATPQFKALLWLSLHDERQVSPDDDYLLERYALAVFWYATYEQSRLDDDDVKTPSQPGSEQDQYNFLKHDGWLTQLGICSWEGVQCHHLGIDKTAVRYDADHIVTHLNLTRNSVRGTMPEELWSTMVDLRVLDLSHNLMAGSIGENVGEWEDLEMIYLNDNFVTGTLPGKLFNPVHESKLEILDVGNNLISGTIPRDIGKLANLKRLALYSCRLTGKIPLSISELRRLDTLYLDENEFTGTIPKEIGDLKELRDLRLRDNKLSSTVPSELGELNMLEILYLDTNQLKGQVPAEIGEMSRLEELHLYKNEFTSKLPHSLGNLRYLKLLYLDSNQFEGPIPESYGEGLHNLQQLYVYNNRLTGTIPSDIYGLDDMEELRLNNNKFTGTLPPELGDLLKLHTLHIEGNLFDGTLPDEMKNLETLEHLRIQENDFTGSVPDGICLLRTGGTGSGSLDEFVADCDEFNPACPCCTECVAHNKPAAEKPDVHEEPEADPTAAPTETPPDPKAEYEEPKSSERLNQIKHVLIEGGITSPESIMQTPKSADPTPQRQALEWIADEDERKLAVTHKFLSERFALAAFWFATFDYAKKHDEKNPPKAGKTALPNWTSTNNWMTSAPICSWFGVRCHESNDADGSVDQFNITNNGIRGSVPGEFYRGLNDVTVLDLSHNLLNGTIDDGVGQWPDLRLLYMNQNYFTGSLPGSIFSPLHTSKLEIIDLGGNWLSGGIPNEIGDLDNLVRLALYENYLTGTVPPFIANCKKLDTLYLDSNDLDGTIPPMVVYQLTQLEDLRLRSNHLHGPIPPQIGVKLPKLKLLYLDDNELTGEIPTSIGSMARLEELHLYKNKLSGNLPKSLHKLRYLTLLYLDSNEIEGSIPKEFGDLHSLEQLFLFNNRLTGSIPDTLYGIENVEELRLNDNDIGGSLPAAIGDLFKLSTLHIENNNLDGSLPSQLGKMDSLEVLRIQNNDFSGTVPDEVCLLRDQSLGEFVSDCTKISCTCCTECS